jgi:hypothetical protein
MTKMLVNLKLLEIKACHADLLLSRCADGAGLRQMGDALLVET